MNLNVKRKFESTPPALLVKEFVNQRPKASKSLFLEVR